MKRTWLRISIVLFSTLFTIFILEIFLRIVDPFKFRPKRDADIFASQTYRLSSNKGLLYELIPDSMATYDEIEFRVNAAGFRDKPYRMRKGSKRRIIVVGDSLTYGWRIPLADTYHKQLEGMLNHRGHAIEVLGMGVVGYNLIQEYFLIRERLARFNPDLLLLQIGPNDFERTLGVKKNSRQGKLLLTPYHDFQIPYMFAKNGFTRFLMNRSHLFKFINLKLFWLKKKRWNNFTPKDVFQLGEEKAFRYLEKIVDYSKKAKIPLAVVIFPFRSGAGHYVYTALHEKIARQLRRMNIPFLDLNQPINSITDRNIWVDGLHPNLEGMAIAARELADFLPPLFQRK